jgi:hypothetical protein
MAPQTDSTFRLAAAAAVYQPHPNPALSAPGVRFWPMALQTDSTFSLAAVAAAYRAWPP